MLAENNEFIEKVRYRLLSLGIETPNEWLMKFSIEKVENKIKNFCNINEVPLSLYNIAVERVAGEILATQKQQSGVTDGELRQISVGDVSMSFSNNENNGNNSILNELLNAGESELLRYRKLKW